MSTAPPTPLDFETLSQRLDDLNKTDVDLSLVPATLDRDVIVKRYRVLERPCYQHVAALRDASHLDLLAQHAQLERVPSLWPFPYRVPRPRPANDADAIWSPGAQQETDDATANARFLLWFAVAHEPGQFGADVLFWQQLSRALPVYYRTISDTEQGAETKEVVRPLGRIEGGVRTAARALVHAAQCRVGAMTTREPDSPNESAGLDFVPGGFEYMGTTVELKGKPLEMLKAIASARGQRISAAELQATVFGDHDLELGTIRSHAANLRKALRRAMKAAGVLSTSDPLPCVDRGCALAWKLQLP